MKLMKLAKLYLILLSLGTILSLYIPKNEATANDAIVIPNEAIRLRILANSDLEADQQLKRQVRDAVNAEITEWVAELTSVEEARTLIESRLPEIQAIAEKVLASEGSEQTVQTDFGTVEFPTKLYGQFLYPAGEYEAILITLGDGKGANWWCVLFPPLCFLDFSNSVAVKEEEEDKNLESTLSEGVSEEESDKETEAEEQANFEEKKEKKSEQEANPEAEAAVAVEDSKDEATAQQEEPVFVNEEKEDEVEVKFFLVELLDKLFS